MKIGKYNIRLHSISAHFTNSLYPIAVFFLVLYHFTTQDSFRNTYFYLMILVTFISPFSYLTGIIEWKQKYKGAKVRVFMRKYRYGLILLGLGAFCTLWYYFNPKILMDKSGLYILFLILNFSILPVAVYLGYLGGKLVYGVVH
jgi:uncharacterized membrane protein